MHTTSISLPQPFDFVSTVTDHGWYDLAPWLWRPETSTLERVERLLSDRVVLLAIRQDGNQLLISCNEKLSTAEEEAVCHGIKRSLRLDQDFQPFYEVARKKSDQTLWNAVQHGRGRLMRTPTLFEDVIKMICTTNINWAQTKQMSQRICDALGSPLTSDPTRNAFPTPSQVAAASDSIFAEEVRLGYRNGSVQHLGREIESGRFDLEALNHSKLRGDDLRKELQKLKGVGPYAAAALAGLIGDYTHLPVDSAYREHVRDKYFNGDKSVPDKALMQIYESWGKWKQLAYWFDRDR
ncbi:MAG: DNA-3-methyladenine glycosylase [Anaerolineae bacterium]